MVMVNKRVFAASDVVKGLLCLAVAAVLAAPVLAQAPAPAPTPTPAPAVKNGKAPIVIPELIDVAVLVEIIGEQLNLRMIYDNKDLLAAGQVTIRPQQRSIQQEDLYHLLDTVLMSKNLAMVKAKDWVRILPADRALLFSRIVPPEDLAPIQEGESYVTENIQLKFADPRDVQDLISLYITETAVVNPIVERKILAVSEYRSRLDMLRQLIALADVPAKKVNTRIMTLQRTKATDIAYKLANYLQVVNQVQQKIGATRMVTPTGVRVNFTPKQPTVKLAPFIEVDERTNRLFLYGLDEDISELEFLVKEFDVEPADFQEITVYPLKYLAATDALTSLQELGYVDSSTATTRTRTGTTRAPGQPGTTGRGGPTVAQTTGDMGGSGAAVRVTVLEQTNSLIVRATHEEQLRIKAFVTATDVDPVDTQKIRVYPLDHRLAEEVATYFKTVFQAGYVDATSRTPVPGIEGAPVIAAVVDTNSLIVNATPAQHDQIQKLLKSIDSTQPQVLLECMLVEITDRNNLDLGIEGEINAGVGLHRSILGSTSFEMSSRDTTTGLRTVSVVDPGGTFAFINDDVVNVLIHALKEDSRGRVLSKPRVVVANNLEGNIVAIDQEPKVVVETVDNVTTEKSDGYEDAGTNLKIKPRISENNFLNLHIEAEVSTFTGTSASAGVPPPKAKRTINTDVVVPDQRTVVIGGLTGRRKLDTVNKIPGFGDLPLIGELFRRTIKEDTETTIYLFVKASILRDQSFEDMFDETKNAKDNMPKDLKTIDSQLDKAEELKEALRMRELDIRRKDERERLERERTVEASKTDGDSGQIRNIPSKPEPETAPETPVITPETPVKTPAVELIPPVVPPTTDTPAPADETPIIVPPTGPGPVPSSAKTPESEKSPVEAQPIIVPPTK
jgi:type II secretory pathway component GspD/PulD (secretin)